MPGTTQPITYDHKLAGVVLSTAGTDGRLTEHRFIEVDIEPNATMLVNGMALYAMQIHEGELPGPYDDEHAVRYAELVLADATALG